MNAYNLRHCQVDWAKFNSTPKSKLTFILDNVFDPMNLAMIARICDSVGAARMILTGDCPSWTHKTIRKSSVHCSDYVNFSWCKTAVEAIRTNFDRVLALEATPTAKSLMELDFKRLKGKEIALVVGNESFGVSKETLTKCDEVVTLPMAGINNSMNVSVALAIAAFNITQGIK